MKLEKVLSQVIRLDAEGGSLQVVLDQLAGQARADVLDELTAIVCQDAVGKLAGMVSGKVKQARATLKELEAGLPEAQEVEAWAGKRVAEAQAELKKLGRGERRRREELRSAIRSAQEEHRKTQLPRKALEGQITSARDRIVFLSGLVSELQAIEAPELEYLPIVWAALQGG
jgi:chromosome segregation ATPase